MNEIERCQINANVCHRNKPTLQKSRFKQTNANECTMISSANAETFFLVRAQHLIHFSCADMNVIRSDLLCCNKRKKKTKLKNGVRRKVSSQPQFWRYHHLLYS